MTEYDPAKTIARQLRHYRDDLDPHVPTGADLHKLDDVIRVLYRHSERMAQTAKKKR